MKKPTVPCLTVLLLGIAFAAHAEKIYWTDMGHNKIRRADLDGTGVEELVTTGLDNPGTIVLDLTFGRMYWTDWTENTIKRANLDGSGVVTLAAALAGPFGLALDLPAGKMYWTEFTSKRIRRANLDGSNVEDLVTTGLPNGVSLDLSAGKMYWGDYANIRRANLDGTNVENLVTTGLSSPMQIALDAGAGKMYWTDLGTDKIQRADLNGANVEDLIAAGLDLPVGLALDLIAGKMYWTDQNATSGLIQRANLSGTGIETLIGSGIGASYGLTLDLRPSAGLSPAEEGPEPGESRPRLMVRCPSPYPSATPFSYTILRPGPARLGIYDAAGRLVRVLLNGSRSAGDHTASWDGLDARGMPVPSGAYFLRLESAGEAAHRRTVVVR